MCRYQVNAVLKSRYSSPIIVSQQKLYETKRATQSRTSYDILQASIVFVCHLWYIIHKAKMRPPIARSCLKRIFLVWGQTFKKAKFYFKCRALHYRMLVMEFPSCEIEKNNLRDSQGKQIRTENKDSFESKVLKQNQHCVAVAAAVVVS